MKDNKEVFSTTLPPISNTEYYVLSIFSSESSLERFEIPSAADTTDNSRLNRLFLLGIISLLLGIFFGFRIKKKNVSFLEMKDQLPPSTPKSSQLFLSKQGYDINITAFHFQRSFCCFIGGNPSEWNEQGIWTLVVHRRRHTI